MVNQHDSCPLIISFTKYWCRQLFISFMEAFLINGISVSYLSLKNFTFLPDEKIKHSGGWWCLWKITLFAGLNFSVRGSCLGCDSTCVSDHSNNSLSWNAMETNWLILMMFPNCLFDQKSTVRILLTFWPNSSLSQLSSLMIYVYCIIFSTFQPVANELSIGYHPSKYSNSKTRTMLLLCCNMAKVALCCETAFQCPSEC